MLTAHIIKTLQSLDKKKFRQKYNLFLVEGNKTIREIPQSPYRIRQIFTTTPDTFSGFDAEVISVTENELRKISFLRNPKDSVAVCELKTEVKDRIKGPQLVLDGIQDPGNLGTIIRLADWFGIGQILCSEDTADFYNPKVIQASMGSFLRVNVVYCDLETELATTEMPVIGTDMDGENLFRYQFPDDFLVVLGNEGNGIRPEIEKNLSQKITIPRFGNARQTESLNVAMSAGIILGQIFAKK